MAYRNTSHGTTKHSPYYMLHGREMVLSTMQSLRAKLSSDIRNTDHAPRLENLKSRLRTAYKLAREHSRKSHATNKRYYDRTAKEREFEVGDAVYLYNPAVKAGLSAKFRRPWTGTWRVTERKSRLNYAIVNQQGKRLVVHVNRLKKAYAPVDREAESKQGTRRARLPKRRRADEGEVDYGMASPGPIVIRGPLVDNPPAEHRTPVRRRHGLDTPASGISPPEAPSNHRVDPTYAPTDTPRSRRQMGDTRDTPPLTRLRSRLQVLQEVPDEEVAD
jgi:ribosomal protein L21E